MNKKQYNILYVEDDYYQYVNFLGSLNKEILKEFRITHAIDLKNAILNLETNQFDLVVSDNYIRYDSQTSVKLHPYGSGLITHICESTQTPLIIQSSSQTLENKSSSPFQFISKQRFSFESIKNFIKEFNILPTLIVG